MKSEIDRLSREITAERFAKMRRVLENRTRKIVVVLEDIFQPHNSSAVLRNCDAFGVQEAVFIENKYMQRINRSVDMGAGKWMTINRFVSPEAVVHKNGMPHSSAPSEVANANTLKALESLKKRGYSLVASTLREDAGSIDDIPVDRPIALMLGTELTGLSEVAHSCADYFFRTTMLGFAQSFNLSVFSALCLDNLSKRMRKLDDSWKLSESEKDELLLEWLKLS